MSLDQKPFGSTTEAEGTPERPPLNVVSEDEEEPSNDCVCAICYELLVDPVTLNCGHTFCQLCVAKLCKNRNFLCPFCKQPCLTVPSVNIQLRNIIESKHQRLTLQRRTAMTAEDKLLVDSLSRISINTTRHQPVRINMDRQLIKFLVYAGIIALFLVICAVMATITILATTRGETSFVAKPVSSWSPSDVAHWVGGLGEWAHQYQEVFTRQKINGPRLLLLREEEDLHTLGIVHGFPAAGLLEAIDELRHQEYYRPRNFQEYRAGHQKQTLLLAICYKLWPRTTLLYTYMFSYDDVFVPVLKTYFPALGQGRVQEGGQHLESQTQPGSTESEAEAKQLGEEGTVVIAEEGTEVLEGEMTRAQQLVTFAAILLVPHLLVGRFAWSWIDVHPLVCFAVIAHCILSSWRELTAVTKSWNGPWKNPLDVAKTLLRDFISFSLTTLAITVVWPFTPHFICEILFYLILWHSVLTAYRVGYVPH